MKKRVLKLTAFFLVFVVAIGVLSYFSVSTSKGSKTYLKGFYLEPENSLDVLMIGASELYTGYSPPLAYRDYGFTSYQVCFAGAPGSLYQSMLTEGLSRQKPKLVVVEVNGFFYDEKRMLDEGSLRNWLDNLPKNENWRKTIQKLVPEKERYAYYFNYFKYHSAWNQIPKTIFQMAQLDQMNRRGYSLMKSFSTKTEMMQNHSSKKLKVNRKNAETLMKAEKPKKMKVKQKTLYQAGLNYLDEFLTYCKEQNVPVLFVRFPHVNNMDPESEKVLKKKIESAGYPFVNFDWEHEQMGISETRDFYNAEHMNVLGAEKFTRYLGKYLTTHYDLKSEHSEEVQKEWNHCAEYASKVFKVLKNRTLKNEKKRYDEFSDYGATIEVTS